MPHHPLEVPLTLQPHLLPPIGDHHKRKTNNTETQKKAPVVAVFVALSSSRRLRCTVFVTPSLSMLSSSRHLGSAIFVVLSPLHRLRRSLCGSLIRNKLVIP
ncbi:hypothetical protein DEO72_LG7g2032 [Vigna unguiculata]|uniref:Uncharacterized protein n=1 Tax=Vigna unguiculata TaxID=3917 RepID=A0A4D6MJF5_VIGUN|nr:hypothetical protein DEO72_LG7g2032 [Vigna unguiculata]